MFESMLSFQHRNPPSTFLTETLLHFSPRNHEQGLAVILVLNGKRFVMRTEPSVNLNFIKWIHLTVVQWLVNNNVGKFVNHPYLAKLGAP